MPAGRLIPVVSAWQLMGEARLRRSLFGRLVVEVREGRRRGYVGFWSGAARYDEAIETRWRAATVYDMAGLDGIDPLSTRHRLPAATPRPWPQDRPVSQT